MNQTPPGSEHTPADARAVAAASEPVTAVCQYTRWVAATAGLVFVAFIPGTLATAHTTASRLNAYLAAYR